MKKIFLISTVFVLFCSFPGISQHSIRLTEGWEFIKQDLGGIWEAVRSSKEGGADNLLPWEKVTLPHCFNASDAVDPDRNYYQGPGWYRTQVEINNPYPDGRTLLHFEGAGQKTQVYIFNTLVGSHVGGYDEFSIDITDDVRDFVKSNLFRSQFKGKIPITVRCDNSRDLEMIPSDLSDFTIYGGLYRYVNLVYVPGFSLQRVFVDASANAVSDVGNLDISALVYNKSVLGEGIVNVNILGPGGEQVASGNAKIFSSSGPQDLLKLVIKNPKLWSPGHPALYTCQVTLKTAAGEQTVTEKFGFRYFEFVNKGPFKLNGQRLLLRGTHRHEDHAGVGQAMTEDMIRTEMKMIREMGANFIRLGHYQQSRIVLNLCDSLGIMVWEEIPWCRGGLGGNVYQEQAKRMLTNMIEQHRNHPAVIIWGLGNENDWPGDFIEFNKDKIRAFMSELNELSHKLDPTRKTAIRRCDFCKDIVDVYSPSIWAGWYRGRYTEYKESTEKEMQTVNHFFHAEWGGDSHARRHSEDPDKITEIVKTGNGTDERLGDAKLKGGTSRVSRDGDWSETYICNLVDWHLKEQETMPWLTGSAFWIFKDFSTPGRPENPVPFVNQKGVVERDLTKKEGYYVFQSYWSDKPMVHIYGHTWPFRWGDEGEPKMIKVYSNCPEAELFLNGISYGLKKRNSQDFPAAGLRWIVKFNPGANIVKVIAHKGKETFTDEIKFDYQAAKWGPPAKMILEKVIQEGDTATIKVQLVDSRGVKCLDAVNAVEFLLAGDGRLLDDLGTSAGSRKVQVYNGIALIRIKTNKGKNVAGVKSEGLQTVFLEL